MDPRVLPQVAITEILSWLVLLATSQKEEVCSEAAYAQFALRLGGVIDDELLLEENASSGGRHRRRATRARGGEGAVAHAPRLLT